MLPGRRGAQLSAVRAALERADLVHLAAHGTFRSDAPLFSSLRLADGPLTVYELERLRSAPSTLILPACDAAQLEVRPGDELLGHRRRAPRASGWGRSWRRCCPCPTRRPMPLMLSLHERPAGTALPPSAALAAAAAAEDDPVGLAFVCIGANERSAP